MAIKIFIFIINLLLPIIMLVFGNVFLKHPPGKVNMAYGYRTKRSMKNQETWKFAHQYCGKIWKHAGIVMLVATLVISIAGFFMEENVFGGISVVLMHVQLAALIGTIYPVERALKENFDENGNRKKVRIWKEM